MEEREKREAQRLIFKLYPDEDAISPKTGEVLFYSRHKYPKHMEFFRVGSEYRERGAMAANRIGKSFGMGGYETACHLTGLYPHWWDGRRFDKPINAWAAGKTNESTRDIVQKNLMGEIQPEGNRKSTNGHWLIPKANIGPITWKSGVQDLIDTVKIKHASGGWSLLGFKSYQQGRGSFEGTAQDLIWFDEEPPRDVYGEALIRTATTNGILMTTFTPLEGLSETALLFVPEEQH